MNEAIIITTVTKMFSRGHTALRENAKVRRATSSRTGVIEICVTSSFPIYGNHNVVYQPVIVPAVLRNALLRDVRIIGVHLGLLSARLAEQRAVPT